MADEGTQTAFNMFLIQQVQLFPLSKDSVVGECVACGLYENGKTWKLGMQGFFFFKEFIYTVPHLYIDYLVAGITSRHYSILTVHHFGTKYTYKYMQTTVIATNGITTYLYIQNHTARNMSIAHKFVNVILIHSCKTVS